MSLPVWQNFSYAVSPSAQTEKRTFFRSGAAPFMNSL